MTIRKNALFMNYTGNTYHWGCYGTSVEIYDTLIERGYVVTTSTVTESHSINPTPISLESFDDEDFLRSYIDQNAALLFAIRDSDVVVVNGEGTLHRFSPGSLNLLYAMYVARTRLNKPVYLINHSLYPSGSPAPMEPNDTIYKHVLSKLTRIVSREPFSTGIYERLGISAIQGFDSLPRYIHRHGLPLHAPHGYLCLSAGVAMNENSSEAMARAVKRVAGDRPIRFLVGARANPAAEDIPLYRQMRAVLPQLELVDATTIDEWVNTISQADCLISARFHHTIAAFAVGTPVVSLSSNTWKINGLCQLVDQPAPISLDLGDIEERVSTALSAALTCGLGLDEAKRRYLRDLAALNFEGLEG